MPLLLDQNISFRIIKLIERDFFGAKQVRELGFENFTDKKIWDFAKSNQFTIVTFDNDFYELSNYYGHPPKIIWSRIGNAKTNEIAEVLLKRQKEIDDFINAENYKDLACLQIS